MAAPPQNEKTIQFWDNLYLEDADHHKEWFLHPEHDTMLEKLYEALPNKKKSGDPIRVLEIGCGTSTLAKSFWQYCQDQQQPNNYGGVSIRATDVSQVCIQQLKDRDRDVMECNHNEKGKGRLEYGVFNIIAEPLEEDKNANTDEIQPNSFDMIVDKGCLDTFAFRSRQRGSQKGALVETVLHKVHSLLKGGSTKTEAGVYVIVSPRSRFKAVRDFSGFTVDRTVVCKEAELVQSNNINANDGGQQQQKRETLYMYTCRKSNAHREQKLTTSEPPSDTDSCPKCGVSFLDFRKEERRGIQYWTRRFRAHVRHCKG